MPLWPKITSPSDNTPLLVSGFVFSKVHARRPTTQASQRWLNGKHRIPVNTSLPICQSLDSLRFGGAGTYRAIASSAHTNFLVMEDRIVNPFVNCTTTDIKSNLFSPHHRKIVPWTPLFIISTLAHDAHVRMRNSCHEMRRVSQKKKIKSVGRDVIPRGLWDF